MKLDVSERHKELIEDIMSSHGFDSLRETQRLAFNEGILDDKNALLIAETGNGKTLCAEAVVKKERLNGERVAYLVPSRQLVGDKIDTISDWSDDKIGRSPSDNNDITVCTFEALYTYLITKPNKSEYGQVILDDFHEVYSSYRGPNIEKAIASILDRDMSIFSMSATIGNPVEIGEWLNANVVVSDESRGVEIKEEVRGTGSLSKKEAISRLLSEERDKCPFLVFSYSRSWAEARAKHVAEQGIFVSGENSSQDLKQRIRGRLDGEMTDKMEDLADMLSKGVGYHHSDLPRGIRSLVEELFHEGAVKCLFSTTTVAYGFDSPVQSVVVGDIRRGNEPIGVWEFQQWIGRAARPGYGYDKGYAFVLSDNKEWVRNNYFKPRNLEPVRTHIEDDSSFRKMLLELVDSGWVTDDSLLSYCRNTLYWSQLKKEVGRATESIFETEISDGIKWLSDMNFLSISRISKEYNTTKFGEGTVQFMRSNYSRFRLTSVHKFFSWLNSRQEIDRYSLAAEIATQFNYTLSSRSTSDEISEKLTASGRSSSDGNVTAAVVVWYWCNNLPLDEIEKRTNVDASKIPGLARRIGRTIESSEPLFDASHRRKPDWLDDFSYRVRKGIRRDEIPLVREVSGIGRFKCRMLREFLSGSAPVTDEIDAEDPIVRQLHELMERCGSSSKFKSVLSDQVHGVGDSTASSIHESLSTIEEFRKNTDDRAVENEYRDTDITSFTD